MTGKEAYEDVIDFCEKQAKNYNPKDGPMTAGVVKGILIVKAATERKRDRAEREEE